jgi:hypothetical protein
MCCNRVKKTAKVLGNIARGYAYLAGGVNEDLSKQRMKICRNCPKLLSGMVCAVCGCSVAAKSRIPEEECPAKKWLKAA